MAGLGLFAPIIQLYSVLPKADPRSGTLNLCQAPTWVQIFRDSPGLTFIPTDFEGFLTKKSTGSSGISKYFGEENFATFKLYS